MDSSLTWTDAHFSSFENIYSLCIKKKCMQSNFGLKFCYVIIVKGLSMRDYMHSKVRRRVLQQFKICSLD